MNAGPGSGRGPGTKCERFMNGERDAQSGDWQNLPTAAR